MIRVATRARSVDELVAKLAPFADEDGLMLPATSDVLAAGEERLAVELADRRVVLSGRVRVEAAAGTTGAPALVRVTFRDLDMEGRRVHERLLARRRLDSTRMRLPTPGVRTDASVMRPLPAPANARDPGALQALVERVSVEPGGGDLEAQNPTRKLSMAPPPPLAPFPERPGAALGNDDETVVAISSEDVEPAVEPARARTSSMPPPLAPPRLPLPAPGLPGDDATPAPDAAVPLPPLRPVTPSDDPLAGRRTGGVARQPGAVEKIASVATSDASRARLRRIAPWVIAGVCGFLVGRASVRRAPSPVVVASVPSAAPPPVAPEPPAPPIPTAAVPPPAPAPEPAARAAGCTATVRSEPPGTAVQWGDATLGETPLVGVSVPCGRALVSLRRPRYQPLVRNVSAAPGEPVTVQERLSRPEAQLVVTTNPPGAHVAVNGQDRGRAPQELTVPRYETARIEAKLDGQRAVTKKIYVDRATERLELDLGGGRRAKPKRK